MSGTDKTRPWWVKIQEAPVEVHDHRNGVCDIAGVGPSRATVGFRPSRCYFDGRWYDPDLKCSCSMCRYVWPDNRRRRRQGKLALRDWRREYE